MTNLGIVGFRNFNDFEFLEEKILEWEIENGEVNTVVSGDTTGVDSLAETYAKKYNKKLIKHKAQWKKLGRKAGPLLNTKIVEDVTHLIAFPSKKSVGTFDTINKAKKKGVPVEIIYVD